MNDDAAEGRAGPVRRLLGSVTHLAATLLDIGRTRMELVSVELQLELRRVAASLALGFVALVAALIGAVMAGFAVIVAFWDTHRLLAAVLVALVFIVVAAVAGLVLASKLKNWPRMFEGTVAELRRDSARLRGRSQ